MEREWGVSRFNNLPVVRLASDGVEHLILHRYINLIPHHGSNVRQNCKFRSIDS